MDPPSSRPTGGVVEGVVVGRAAALHPLPGLYLALPPSTQKVAALLQPSSPSQHPSGRFTLHQVPHSHHRVSSGWSGRLGGASRENRRPKSEWL